MSKEIITNLLGNPVKIVVGYNDYIGKVGFVRTIFQDNDGNIKLHIDIKKECLIEVYATNVSVCPVIESKPIDKL